MKFPYCYISIILLFISISCPAWNARGHMVVAAIAYHQMTVKQQEWVTELLINHPEYLRSWQSDYQKIQTPPALGLYLFMRAGLWPDEIINKNHPNHLYSHPKWHYINYELRFPYRGERKIVDHENILKAIDLNMGLYKSGSLQQQAIALCWLVHLVGDLHQPLHSVSLFNEQYPNGDRGGNDFWVAAKGSSNLHYFWDGLLGKSTKTGSVLNEATALHSKSFLNYENTTTDPVEWSLESFKIARQAVYLQGELRGSKDKAQAPLLPPDYGRNSKQIAEKCVVLAGYRLAKLLER